MELSSSSARCPYEEKEKIADGSFGSVFVYKKMGGELCAGKKIPKASLCRADENKILKDVAKHAENVVHYIDTYVDDTFVIFFMELCDATVHQYVTNKLVTLYNHQEKIKVKDHFHDITPLQICEQAVKGIEHLHKCDIIHRDVKSSNFLMVQTKAKTLVKVSDFGLSRQLPPDEHGVRTKSHGTPAFTAPECYEDVEQQTKAIDIFSLGIFIYYVLTDGRYPFGKEIFDQESNIRGKKSPNIQDLLNNENVQEETKITAGDLIKRMIKYTARDRFTIGDVVAHPSFWNSKKKVDFYVELNTFMQSKDLNQHFRKLNKSQGKVDYYEKLSKCDAGLKENGKDDGFKTLVISHSNIPQLIKSHPMFKYDETIKDLLRLIRNLDAHGRDSNTSDKIKKLLGMYGKEVNGEKFLLTLTGSYPELLVHLYEFFRNSKVAVEYYQPLQNVSGVNRVQSVQNANHVTSSSSFGTSSTGNVAISSWEKFYRHENNLSESLLFQYDIILEYNNQHVEKWMVDLKSSSTRFYYESHPSLMQTGNISLPDLRNDGMVSKILESFKDGLLLRLSDARDSLIGRRECIGRIFFTSHLEGNSKKLEQQKDIVVFSHVKFIEQFKSHDHPKREVQFSVGSDPSKKPPRVVITVRPRVCFNLPSEQAVNDIDSISLSLEKRVA